jgi:hypothetical protein
MRSSGFKFQTTIRRRAHWYPGSGPDFFTDPARGCAPEKTGDLDLFYSESPSGRAKAIQICRTECPFRRACDEYATVNHEKWGVWGGRSRDPRLVPVDDQRVYQLWRQHWTDGMIAALLGTTPRAVLISRNRQGLFTPGDGKDSSGPQL